MSTEKRKNLRFKTRFDALFGSGPQEGSGALVDLSYSGARLDNTSAKPEIGTRVRLYIFVQPIAPFEIVGHVVRHTENGFALACDVFDPDMRSLVDDVSALVDVRG